LPVQPDRDLISIDFAGQRFRLFAESRLKGEDILRHFAVGDLDGLQIPTERAGYRGNGYQDMKEVNKAA
jgi:hypothetical protein